MSSETRQYFQKFIWLTVSWCLQHWPFLPFPPDANLAPSDPLLFDELLVPLEPFLSPLLAEKKVAPARPVAVMAVLMLYIVMTCSGVKEEEEELESFGGLWIKRNIRIAKSW